MQGFWGVFFQQMLEFHETKIQEKQNKYFVVVVVIVDTVTSV